MIINILTTENLKRKNKLKTKRELKSKLLIKKLLNQLIIDNNINTDFIPIKLRIKRKYNAKNQSFCRHYFNAVGDTIEQVITIDLNSIKNDRIKKGYQYPNYYNGRPEKLNPIIKNNFKNCLRFIILHEFAHAKYKRLDNYYNTEFNADNFAIDNLEKYGGKIR